MESCMCAVGSNSSDGIMILVISQKEKLFPMASMTYAITVLSSILAPARIPVNLPVRAFAIGGI